MIKQLLPVFALATANSQYLIQDVSTLPNYDVMAQAQLELHNQWRADLANGVTYPGVYGTNINKLVWSDELAEQAQTYANKCGHFHDKEEIDRLNVGENLAFYGHHPTNDALNSDARMAQWGEKIANRWPTKEHTYFNDDATYYPNEPNFYLNNPDNTDFSMKILWGAGHYTQFVWAETTEVGCGNVICSDLTKESGAFYTKYPGYNFFMSVCRYRVRQSNQPNFFDRTFDASQVGSACQYGVEDGLCLPAGADAGENAGGSNVNADQNADNTDNTNNNSNEVNDQTNDEQDDLACNWLPEIEENVNYQIRNSVFNDVFDIWYNHVWPGQPVHTYWHAHGHGNQQFKFTRNQADCTYGISVKNNFISVTDKMELKLAAADKGNAELKKFEVIPVGDNTFRLSHDNMDMAGTKKNGKVVFVEGSDAETGPHLWKITAW